MGTITNQTTTKLHRELLSQFLPAGEMLRSEGVDDYEVIKIFNDYVKSQQIRFYKRRQAPLEIRATIDKILANKADSKIEIVYCDLLYQAMIPFEFQYKIGKYRADFLINEWLVFEIDGPDHDKEYDAFRDKYMEKMGYEILRVSAWMASACPSAVIDEIKDLYKNGI